LKLNVYRSLTTCQDYIAKENNLFQDAKKRLLDSRL
jgi:hypothetical protein